MWVGWEVLGLGIKGMKLENKIIKCLGGFLEWMVWFENEGGDLVYFC